MQTNQRNFLALVPIVLFACGYGPQVAQAAQGIVGGTLGLEACIQECSKESDRDICDTYCRCILWVDTSKKEIHAQDQREVCIAEAKGLPPPIPQGRLSVQAYQVVRLPNGEWNDRALTLSYEWEKSPLYALLNVPEVTEEAQQQLVRCGYVWSGDESGSYYFWSKHAPKNIQKMISVDSQGVLRSVGSGTVVKCPDAQEEAAKLHRKGTAAYSKWDSQ